MPPGCSPTFQYKFSVFYKKLHIQFKSSDSKFYAQKILWANLYTWRLCNSYFNQVYFSPSTRSNLFFIPSRSCLILSSFLEGCQIRCQISLNFSCKQYLILRKLSLGSLIPIPGISGSTQQQLSWCQNYHVLCTSESNS